jgi:RNA polymerase sigma factor (sigma-70 family)
MARTNDPRKPHPSHLRLVATPVSRPPLPPVVPLLRPDQPVSPAQEAMLTGLARRAHRGDREARDLLWRAFGPRLEPALRRCGRMTRQPHWVRRDGRPWEVDDLRQEAWLVFAELVDGWNEEGSFVPYATAYFPWRLRDAMRRLEPPRRMAAIWCAARIGGDDPGLNDAETAELLAAIAAALPPGDAELLHMRVTEGASVADMACRLGMSRRTVARRWARVRREARWLLLDAAPGAQPQPPRSDPAGAPDGW